MRAAVHKKVRKNLRIILIKSVLSKLQECDNEKERSSLIRVLDNSICCCGNSGSCLSVKTQFDLYGKRPSYILHKSKKRQKELNEWAKKTENIRKKLEEVTFWVDIDMVWIPREKKWICIDCYNGYIETYK